MLPEPLDAQSQLRAEEAVYAALVPGIEHVAIWQPQYALMVTASEARLPTFAQALACAGARGTPVHVRGSGGGAGCLGPGTLVVSHLYTSARNDIDAAYRRFSQCLIAAFADVDVLLTASQVSRAYCDGRFDLSWHNHKVGGMAQRRCAQGGLVRIWIHAVLSISAESQHLPEEVERFYADLRVARIADPRMATTLADCLTDGVPATDLLGRCAAAIGRQFGPLDGRSIWDLRNPLRFA